MTSRPDGDGKLPLTELGEMTGRGERIVMVTAYDYPSGRLADAAGIDLILVGDSAAMTVLGHASTVPATMEEMLMLTRAVTRAARAGARDRGHALRLLPGLRRGSGAKRHSLRQGGRRRRRQARRRRAEPLARRGARRRRHPRHGPPRPDAAVGHHARRLPGPGADRGEGARSSCEDALALEHAGCFALVLEAVPAPVADADQRRLAIPTIGIGSGAGLRRPGARPPRPARPLRRPLAALRQALRGDRRGDPAARSSASPRRSAPAPSRRRSTRTRCRRRSWRLFAQPPDTREPRYEQGEDEDRRAPASATATAARRQPPCARRRAIP